MKTKFLPMVALSFSLGCGTQANQESVVQVQEATQGSQRTYMWLDQYYAGASYGCWFFADSPVSHGNVDLQNLFLQQARPGNSKFIKASDLRQRLVNAGKTRLAEKIFGKHPEKWREITLRNLPGNIVRTIFNLDVHTQESLKIQFIDSPHRIVRSLTWTMMSEFRQVLASIPAAEITNPLGSAINDSAASRLDFVNCAQTKKQKEILMAGRLSDQE